MRPYVVLTALLGLVACQKPRPALAPAPGNTVNIRITEKGFEPSRAMVKAGEPVKLVVTRTTDETCATEIVVPDAHVDEKLPLNQPVTVTFTPPHAGELGFQCGMGMLKGSLVVTR